MAKLKKGRDISGILLFDKPLLRSSNQVLQRCKHLFKANKAGHTGSLDPLASGLLPICLGEATKFAQYFLDADKTYDVTLTLGKKTKTGDAEGEVILEREVPLLNEMYLQSVIAGFIGEIDQCPPMYSALKHQGEALYALARRGIEIERPTRRITIYRCDLKAYTATTVSLHVVCSKGTYIRTLAEDIGEVIGCGAFVSSLRRTAVAGLPSHPMYTLDYLQEHAENLALLDACLIPTDQALLKWPAYTCTADEERALYQGRRVKVPADVKDQACLRLYNPEGFFMGLSVIEQGFLKSLRLCAYVS